MPIEDLCEIDNQIDSEQIRFRNGDDETMAKMQKQLESLVPRAAEI
jgi:hypothetical protein